jgi:uncharacterized protein YkwD
MTIRILALAGFCLANGLLSIALFADEQSGEPHTEQEATRLITRELTGPYRPQQQADLTRAGKAIFDRINEFRRSKKLDAVVRDPRLDQTAQAFAEYMATTGKYGHFADGRSSTDRATANGYEYCLLEENIAMEFKSNGYATGPLAQKFAKGWQNSPPHRQNILNPAVTQTGIGLAQSSETGAYFAVQMFGRPKSESINFEITNNSASSVRYRVGNETFDLPPRYTRTHTLCSPEKLGLSTDGQVSNPIAISDGMTFAVEDRDGAAKLIEQR